MSADRPNAPEFRIYRPLPSYLVEVFTPGHLLHHFLLASYAYYQYDESAFEDTAFDRLCKRLLEVYDTFEHPHKHLAKKEMLEAGTGFYLKEEDYPGQVRSGMRVYVASINSGQLEIDLSRILIP